ncbi:MAG: sugar isomerase domain-containing protein [Bacillota bacterium]|jgi:uncharacterized phosphosugar-binding protein
MSEEIRRYFSVLHERINQLFVVNEKNLGKAAEICADALSDKKVIHIYDTGHIISHEMIVRTGGLVAYTHLSFEGMLDNHNLWRETQFKKPLPEKQLETEKALIEWVIGQGTIQKGDVLIIGSVSGVGMRLIELALQAKKLGLSVLAITSTSFSSKLTSKHPSGKHLYEVADVVLDNVADYGDSFFEITGIEKKVVPVSGISSVVLMWSLTVGIVGCLAARGVQPSIYESINLPEGQKLVEKTESDYREKGF